jgi:hypothetical protein
MKTLLLSLCIFALTVLTNLSYSQLNVSTDVKEYYDWDNTKEEWVISSAEDPFFSFFEFNEDFTLLTHTTSDITSAYIIKSEEYDEPRDQYTFEVVSDVGNEYLLIMDKNNNNIRFIGEDESGTYLVRFRIKKVWKGE